MAKKSIVTTEITGTADTPSFEQLIDESVFFQPSDEQRKVKIKFFAKIADNPAINLETVSLPTIQQITQSAALVKWWPIPGFSRWFLNKTEHTEALEFLFDLSIQALTNILRSEDPKCQGARVQAAKHVAEMASKMPKKQTSVGQYLDKAISEMDEYQLQAYLQKNGTQFAVGVSKRPSIPEKVVSVEKSIDTPPSEQ